MVEMYSFKIICKIS